LQSEPDEFQALVEEADREDGSVKRVSGCIDGRTPYIFVRQTYLDLLRLINGAIMECRTEGSDHFEIGGSPGIGKMVFAVWLIGRLVSIHKDFAFSRRFSIECHTIITLFVY
jgi:hypothetical protein